MLVGFNAADDAGVFRINDTQALVQTVDFFPPIVDDPYGFGLIAAANALSDVYAMGGRPLTALNIVGFPSGMPLSILSDILRGGDEKIREAGAVVVGGHSIKDKELKYGVAVTGIIDIDKIVTNGGAIAGDKLFLTKPLGTGIVATAIKQGMAHKDDADALTAQMAQLNKTASELMVKHGAHAATDITGFGLSGHGFEMAEASGVSLKFAFDSLPLIPDVLDFAERGAIPGGLNSNREFMNGRISITVSLSKPQSDILFDAQTSGGLLIALSPDRVSLFLKDASLAGLTVWQIGEVVARDKTAIIVI